MRGEPSCPKCGGRVRAPGLFADSWQCDVHGTVHPLQPVIPPSVEALQVVVHRAQVPVWMPWPLPVGWLFTGVACAGDDRSGGRATAVACSGPAPLGGIGRAACSSPRSWASASARGTRASTAPTPGPHMSVEKPPHAKVLAAGRPTPMWHVAGRPGRPRGLRGRGARAVAVGDRVAGAVGPPDVRRAGAHGSAGRGRRGGPAAVRGAVAADPDAVRRGPSLTRVVRVRPRVSDASLAAGRRAVRSRYP